MVVCLSGYGIIYISVKVRSIFVTWDDFCYGQNKILTVCKHPDGLRKIYQGEGVNSRKCGISNEWSQIYIYKFFPAHVII